MGIKTYTSIRTNPIAFIRETYHLYHIKITDIPRQVTGTIWYMQRCERNIQRAIGITLENLKILNIGPGQTPREMAYLGMRNEVVGIDLDVISHKFSPLTYLKMMKRNGLMRTIKTIIRKSTGFDARFNEELKRQLEVSTLPRTALQQMDAASMQFPDASFDMVYSFSVFEHLPDPAKVFDETVRVLRPGGGCYISIHLFTSEDGCHDIRIFANEREGIPYWSHLRPQYAEIVQPNAYLNRMRIAEWKQIIESRMPGVFFSYDSHLPEKTEKLKHELAALRNASELQEYSDEELLSVNLVAIWKKPEEP